MQVVVCLLLCLAALASADQSWDFRGVNSKQEAKQRALASLASADLNDENQPKLRAMFDSWSSTYGITFPDVQARQKAIKTFRANLKSIRDTNLDDNATWWASANQFSHLSSEEFASTYLMAPGSISDDTPVQPWSPPTHSRKLRQIASAVDWVAAGKVTPIRYQGACGCCWAFAATSVVESAYLIRYGAMPSALHLSEQHLVSCVYPNGAGCNGGSSANALNYMASYNQTTNVMYPYTSGTTRVGGTCNTALLKSTQPGQVVKASIGARSVYPTLTESAFQAATQAQPIVIYFSANAAFMTYAGGVFNAPASGCTNTVNHAMVIVGYNTAGRYWKIRNSWGTYWGEQGYARVGFTGNGAGPCGMQQMGIIPSLNFASTRLLGV